MGRLNLLVNDWRRLGLATITVYGLVGYVGIVSLYTIWLGIAARLETRAIFAGGYYLDPFFELGTSLGFWGFVLFIVNFFLATRWRWVERIFGGLDQVYRLHGLLGRTILVFIVLHVAILVVQAVPNWRLAASYLVPGMELTYTIGLASVLLLIFLVAATIWLRFPYDLWLRMHRWMGAAFFLGGAHALVAHNDWYIWLMLALGGYPWFDRSFLSPRRKAQFQGQLSQIRPLHGVSELTVTLDRDHGFRPGQFVFLTVEQSAVQLPREAHPFSISGLPAPNQVRLSAKQVGDFTQQLPALVAGDQLSLDGAYGHFGARASTATGSQLWVAGGIGITPFLSILEAYARGSVRPPQRLVLVWTVRQAAEAVYQAEIEQMIAKLPNAQFVVHHSEKQGRVQLEALLAQQGLAARQLDQLMLCGPTTMMASLRQQGQSLGLRPGQIVSEEFVMR